MKKILLTSISIVITVFVFSQTLTEDQVAPIPKGTQLVSIIPLPIVTKVDTVISTDIYKSYNSFSVKNPLFVVYKLYQGGGDISRTDMAFKTGRYKKGQDQSNYEHSGYDIGHMDNAEDNANNKIFETETFFFFNSLPQTPKSNRGIWKSVEKKTRKKSATDSLRIICGGFDFNLIRFRFLEKESFIIVPAYTFKIVKDLSTNQIKAYLFPNDNSNTDEEIDINQLLENIPFSREIIKLNLL